MLPAPPYVIAVGVADVRREPDPSSELVTQALLNMPVQTGVIQGEWTHITLADYAGWIRSDELDEPPVTGFCKIGEHCATPLPLVAVVSATHTPFCETAGSDSSTEMAYLSTILPLLDTTHPQRLHVALPGERSAWVERSATSIRQANAPYPRESVAAVTRYARLFLGVPYLWGGTSWRGLDCSGLVQLCYRMGGYTIPRDADQQDAALSQTIARDAMQEGDLIFFGVEHIVHVALALNQYEYIHAEGNRFGRVLIHSFDRAAQNFDQRLSDIFRGIKRVVKDRGC